jgi:uncharacterized protein (TIGR03435 family)
MNATEIQTKGRLYVVNMAGVVGYLGLLSCGLSVSTTLAQTRPAFEVATIKPAAPTDQAKETAAVQSGQAPRRGPHYSPGRAEFTDMRLKDLIAIAYNVKGDQVVGPDWLATERFDVVAKLPDGAVKADAVVMLQTLLEERFQLAVRHTIAQRTVLGLMVEKGGLKLHASTGVPRAIDESAPLKVGEVQMVGSDGLVRVTAGPGPNSTTVNMGMNGIASLNVDMESKTRHMSANMITMTGFAQLLTSDRQGMAAGAPQLPIVDMTGIKGYFDVRLDLSMADAFRSEPAGVAADPNGVNASLSTALQPLGLRLEPSKAPVDQLVVDHVQKTPTPN